MIRVLAIALLVAVAVAAMASGAGATSLPGVPSNGVRPEIQQRPSSVSFGTGGDLRLTDIEWGRGTATHARATGTVAVNSCDPDCASGGLRTQRAELTFRVVTHADVPYFNCVRVHLGPGPAATSLGAHELNLPLSPAAYRGTVSCGPAKA
jgi:hypothetical protein